MLEIKDVGHYDIIPPSAPSSTPLPAEWANVVDGIVLINLVSRPDRFWYMRAHLADAGILDHTTILLRQKSPLKMSHVLCYESHVAALRYALRMAWRRVLVLEDDAVLAKNTASKAALALQALESTGNWGRLMLGYIPIVLFPSSCGLQRGFTISATAYIANHAFMKHVVREHIYEERGAPTTGLNYEHWDWIYSMRFFSTTYVTWPACVTTHPELSAVSDNNNALVVKAARAATTNDMVQNVVQHLCWGLPVALLLALVGWLGPGQSKS